MSSCVCVCVSRQNNKKDTSIFKATDTEESQKMCYFFILIDLCKHFPDTFTGSLIYKSTLLKIPLQMLECLSEVHK